MIIISINILVGTEGSQVLKFTYRFDDYIVTTSVVRGLDEGDNTTGIPRLVECHTSIISG
jgi:hypothetical protein